MRIVLEVLEGRALKSICRELGLNRHSVRSWISRYHLYGEDGLCVASSTKRSTAIEKEKIVLFYVGDMEVKDLVAILKNKLPRYMIPNKVEKLEKMPLTANGKLDRVYLKNYYQGNI